MIDFSSIPVEASGDAFVGLRKINHDAPVVLYLPKGCEAWAKRITELKPKSGDRLKAASEAFRLIYRTLERFVDEVASHTPPKMEGNGIPLNIQDAQGKLPALKKWLLKKSDDSGTASIDYTKISFLKDFNEDGVRVDALRRLAQRDAPGGAMDAEAMIERYLDQATHLPGGGLVFEQPVGPRHQLVVEPGDIARLYAFLAMEVAELVGDGQPVDPLLADLAYQYRGAMRLNPADTLFGERASGLLAELREHFAHIEERTPYKDEDYHQLADAVEKLLDWSVEKESGTLFGIGAFWPVWESLCLEWISPQVDNILAVDAGYSTSSFSGNLKNENSLVEDEVRPGFWKCPDIKKLGTATGVTGVTGVTGSLYPDLLRYEKASSAVYGDLDPNLFRCLLQWVVYGKQFAGVPEAVAKIFHVDKELLKSITKEESRLEIFESHVHFADFLEIACNSGNTQGTVSWSTYPDKGILSSLKSRALFKPFRESGGPSQFVFVDFKYYGRDGDQFREMFDRSVPAQDRYSDSLAEDLIPTNVPVVARDFEKLKIRNKEIIRHEFWLPASEELENTIHHQIEQISTTDKPSLAWPDKLSLAWPVITLRYLNIEKMMMKYVEAT